MPRRLITSRGRQVTIEGLDKLQENIAELMSRATGKEVKKIWMQAALELRDIAIQYAPIAPGPITHYEKGQAPRTIQPGALRAAIFAAYGKETAPNVLVGVNYKIAPHAHWIEFGNSRIPAQPYMRPALASARSRCVSIIADGYRTLLIDKGSVANPSSSTGILAPPAITQGRIGAVRLKAARTWAEKKAAGLVPGKHGGWITVAERARLASLRPKKKP